MLLWGVGLRYTGHIPNKITVWSTVSVLINGYIYDYNIFSALMTLKRRLKKREWKRRQPRHLRKRGGGKHGSGKRGTRIHSPALWCYVFYSRVFHSRVFSAPMLDWQQEGQPAYKISSLQRRVPVPVKTSTDTCSTWGRGELKLGNRQICDRIFVFGRSVMGEDKSSSVGV